MLPNQELLKKSAKSGDEFDIDITVPLKPPLTETWLYPRDAALFSERARTRNSRLNRLEWGDFFRSKVSRETYSLVPHHTTGMFAFSFTHTVRVVDNNRGIWTVNADPQNEVRRNWMQSINVNRDLIFAAYPGDRPSYGGINLQIPYEDFVITRATYNRTPFAEALNGGVLSTTNYFWMLANDYVNMTSGRGAAPWR